MQRLFLSFLLMVFLLFCFSQEKKNNSSSLLPEYNRAEKIFMQAEKRAISGVDNETNQAMADSLYRSANALYTILLPVSDQEKNDSLGFLIRLRTAFIASYFDSIALAKDHYLAAIALKQDLPGISDTMLFIPYLYTGGIYYTYEQFDSALIYYKKAEVLNARFGLTLEGSERLYNRMGIMFYETGNYRQAGNYFEKAISLTNAGDKDQLVNYKINIGSMLIKLEEYERAKQVYESLLPYDLYRDPIHHNLGIIYSKIGDPKKAIELFRKVYYNNKKKKDLYYNYAMAWSALSEKDSSDLYIEKALAENIKWNGHKKNTALGLLLAFKASQFSAAKDHQKALENWQESIMQFDPEFEEKDLFNNPSGFTGVYSYINLFNSLVAKAGELEALFNQQKDQQYLEASLNTYTSAFDLADYVERTYNSDEARLFIARIKYNVHSRPIDAAIQLYDLTKEKKYLEDAYRFDQQNKASVLLLNLQENEQKRNGIGNKALLEEENDIRSSITRLLLRSSQSTDTLKQEAMRSSIRDYEIQLGTIHDKMNEDPSYRGRVILSKIPAVTDIQKKLDNKTAILSYHLSSSDLLLLFISGNRFDYYRIPVSRSFFDNIDSFKTSLSSFASPGSRTDSSYTVLLYKKLFSPVLSALSAKERLIIIPDDELNYLPFEALQDEKGNYLVQKFSITYQYSTALLENNLPVLHNNRSLAFAPFASEGFMDGRGTRLPVLSASREEISTLKGKVMIDSAATKENFRELVNHYKVVHLATHASANNIDPSQSYIAFYPGRNDSSDYKLYAPEIYDMELDSTDLVILSACETGTGQLVKGEGLMSLSRAFAYAGCPNIITSLWKADDKSTAFITQQLHEYLEKGMTKDKALQQAKLDLLNDDAIDPRLKYPGYWAHLVFIGAYEPDFRRSNWWKIALAIIATASLYIYAKEKAWFK